MNESVLMMMNKLYRWRVRASFIGLILAIILAKPSLRSISVGLAIFLWGLGLRAWACGHIRKEKELTVSGPYQYTRNPLYLANFIIGVSVAMASNSWWVAGIFAVYFLLFYPLALKREKEKMIALFPEEYEKYKKKVPLFFPSFKHYLGLHSHRFSFQLYLNNREYRALLGGLIFWLAMILKFVFMK